MADRAVEGELVSKFPANSEFSGICTENSQVLLSIIALFHMIRQKSEFIGVAEAGNSERHFSEWFWVNREMMRESRAWSRPWPARLRPNPTTKAKAF